MKEKVTLMTFNTLGVLLIAQKVDARFRKTAQLINEMQPDIVCLEELFFYPTYKIYKSILKDYPYVLYEKYLVGPRGGLVIFSKIPLEKVDFIPFTFPKDARAPFYTHIAGNGVLVAKAKNMPFYIASTHLTSDVVHILEPHHTYYKIIKHQSEMAADVIKEYAQKESTFLVGDFNIAKDSPLYKAFLERSGANDVFSKETKPTYYAKRLHYKFQAINNARIDYIFLKQRQQKFDIIDSSHLFEKEVPLSDGTMSYLSDHVGLQITFSIL